MITGLHHITAITSDGRANVRFYRDVLGLKLVKKTVNFDDPTSWHLYYGDETGSPGSIVTFFIYTGLPRGSAGWPSVSGISLRLPRASAEAVSNKLRAAAINFEGYATPDGQGEAITMRDPDGMRVDVVFHDAADEPALYAPGLDLREGEPTLSFVERLLDWQRSTIGGTLPAMGPATAPALVHLGIDPAKRGRPGAGTVHHIAFNVATDEEQVALRERLVAAGVNVSPVMDRSYFKSIYFREPGGILFEIATTGPGFAVDEPADALGQRLCLPPQYEPHRAEIEKMLPPLE